MSLSPSLGRSLFGHFFALGGAKGFGPSLPAFQSPEPSQRNSGWVFSNFLFNFGSCSESNDIGRDLVQIFFRHGSI